MESDGEVEQNFAKQGGEALNLDDNDGFNDSEDVDDVEDDDDNDAGKKEPSAQKPAAAAQQKEVKGEKLENQPYDLAVDVNDSEEIESEEEEDEVNMNDVGRAQQTTGQPAGAAT